MFEVKFTHVNQTQKKDFLINRPEGIKYYDLVFFKTKTNIEINGKMELIGKNTMIIYSKNARQYYYTAESILLSDFIHFDVDNEIMDTALKNLVFDKPFPIEQVEAIEKLIWLISFEFYNGYNNSKSNISHLLNVLFKKIEEEISFSNDRTNYGQFKDMVSLRYKIMQNPNQNWNIKMLAKECNMSESYFQIIYKKLFDTSCINDIINARLEMAQEMIVNSTLSIQEIASNCGYKNIEHFSRQFKKKYKTTPLKYRNYSKEQPQLDIPPDV